MLVISNYHYTVFLTSGRMTPSPTPVLPTQRFKKNHLPISSKAGNFSANPHYLRGGCISARLEYLQAASFPSLGPLGPSSKPCCGHCLRMVSYLWDGVSISEALGCNDGHPLPLPGCLLYLSVLSFLSSETVSLWVYT